MSFPHSARVLLSAVLITGMSPLITGPGYSLSHVWANEKFKEDSEEESAPDNEKFKEKNRTIRHSTPARKVRRRTKSAGQAAASPIAGPGEKVFTTGLLVGNGLIGGELEMFINRNIGFVAGVGLIGAGAGINLHISTGSGYDFYINPDAKYFAGFGFIPAVELGYRRFYGRAKKYGLSVELGAGFHTQKTEVTLQDSLYVFNPGDPMLTYNLGFAINL